MTTTTDITTTIKKGGNGWQAESTLVLFGKRAIRITTDKNIMRGGIDSDLSGITLTDTGFQMVFGLAKSGGDLRRTILEDRAARCTEKSIRTMHAQALAQLDALKAEALAYYASEAPPKGWDKVEAGHELASIPEQPSLFGAEQGL